MSEWLEQFLDDPEYPNDRIDVGDCPTRIEAARRDYARLRAENERLTACWEGAASEARRFMAEVERLRGALRLLLDKLDEAGCTADGHPGPDCWVCNEEAAARAALEGKP